MITALQTLVNWVWPNDCFFCHNKALKHVAVCVHCYRDLPWIEASNAESSNHEQFAFRYEPPIANLITQLKFQHRLFHAHLLGQLLAERLQHTTLPELIIPVPLHKQRLRQRGFNQALEIAKPIANRFQIPIAKRTLVRCKDTKPQSSLAANLRKHNITHAFKQIRPIHARHIAIIDDVMTTGNTIQSLLETINAPAVTKSASGALQKRLLRRKRLRPRQFQPFSFFWAHTNRSPCLQILLSQA